jgi:hypothetical protein
MASGTITLVNDTDMELSYNISENGQYDQNYWVASGVIGAHGTEDVPVSGYELYQVNFGTPNPTTYNAQQVSAESQVVFQVGSSPTTSGSLSSE